ncbi:hypothetical protein [Aeropyrum camini]|nr:hypothetical protein [Aeropyrum camini]
MVRRLPASTGRVFAVKIEEGEDVHKTLSGLAEAEDLLRHGCGYRWHG